MGEQRRFTCTTVSVRDAHAEWLGPNRLRVAVALQRHGGLRYHTRLRESAVLIVRRRRALVVADRQRCSGGAVDERDAGGGISLTRTFCEQIAESTGIPDAGRDFDA